MVEPLPDRIAERAGHECHREHRHRTGTGAIVGSFVSALWYNALVTPLAFVMLAYVLLWRNGMRGAA